MRFCRENIDRTGKAVWSFNSSTAAFKDNEFTAPLLSDSAATDSTLHIYKVKDSGFRLRVDPGQRLSHYRYNILHDDLIVNSTVIASHQEIKHSIDQAGLHELSSDKFIVSIQPNPLVISFKKEDKVFLQLNSDNFMYIEDGSPTPDETFENMTESFPNGKTSVGMSFSFQSKEARITGFLEGNNPLNLPDSKEERRYARDGYSLYGSVPLFFAHCKDFEVNPSVFWMNPSDMMMRIQTTNQTRDLSLISEGGFIDFVVFLAPLPKMLKQYTLLTGVQPLPPAFALGYQQSRWGFPSQKHVEDVLFNLTQAGFPYDVTWLDIDHLDGKKPFTMNYTWFYNAEKMFNDATKEHRILIRIADPHMMVNDTYKQYVEAKEKGYFLQYQGNDFVASSWPGKSSWPDYLRKDVRDWWAEQFKSSDFPNCVFIWNDMNEIAAWESMEGTAPKDSTHMNGTVEVREVHSIYGLSMTAATHKALVERGTGRTFILTRSFFAGSQKYTWHWSGDNDATWDHLRFSIDTLLNSNLNGMPFTGSDIGGFCSNVTAQLLARWYQVGCLLYPLYREHSSNFTVNREPYLFEKSNPAEFAAMRTSVTKRYHMLPLLYTAAAEASKKSIPFVAPLWYEFPQSNFDDIAYQPIVGGKLMVVPILYENQTSISITKPPGKWYAIDSGKELTENYTVNVTMADLPAFYRGGTVTASFSTIGQTVYETFTKNLTLHISLDESNSAKGKLYFDDLSSLGYQKGDYLIPEIKYKDNKIKITPSGNTSRHYIVNTIHIYGLKSVPNFNIPGSSVSFDEPLVIISNLKIDLAEKTEIETGMSQTTKIIIISVSSVVGVAIIALVVIVICRYSRASKGYENVDGKTL